jgi:hypothetical protein
MRYYHGHLQYPLVQYCKITGVINTLIKYFSQIMPKQWDGPAISAGDDSATGARGSDVFDDGDLHIAPSGGRAGSCWRLVHQTTQAAAIGRWCRHGRLPDTDPDTDADTRVLLTQ